MRPYRCDCVCGKGALFSLSLVLLRVSLSFAQPSAVILTAGQSNADGRVPLADVSAFHSEGGIALLLSLLILCYILFLFMISLGNE